jgi:predicted nucleotide-binding protein
MTKKMKSIKQDNSPTLLIKLREQFKGEIDGRIKEGNMLLDQVKNQITNFETLEKARSEYYAWDDYNAELIKQSFNKSENEYYLSYTSRPILMGTIGHVPSIKEQINTHYNNIKGKIDRLEKLKNKIELIPLSTNLAFQNPPKVNEFHSASAYSKVFIVHGHDSEAKTEVARFIEKLGLEAIILHEQTNSGMTIIEKIEAFTNVNYGIILYTPCDTGSKMGDTSNSKPRARQNVVFEHGFLIAKLGRKNVCALVKGNTETPSDISGVVYLPFDEHNSWQFRVAKEMKASGFDIDLNNL